MCVTLSFKSITGVFSTGCITTTFPAAAVSTCFVTVLFSDRAGAAGFIVFCAVTGFVISLFSSFLGAFPAEVDFYSIFLVLRRRANNVLLSSP